IVFFSFVFNISDTAAVYRNEADIGRSLKELLPKYGLTRKDVFITSKLSPRDHGFDSAEKACLNSVEALGCKYLDLYLIHWPGVQKLKREDPKNAQLRNESWQALEKLYKAGLVRSIGVSNYTVDHLEELLQFALVVPAVLQVEFHPRLYQKNLHEYCQSKRIWLQAYTSLGQGKLLDEEVVRSIATQHNKSTAQVLLRWALQHGVGKCMQYACFKPYLEAGQTFAIKSLELHCFTGIIPKSVRSQHIQDNISITEFELSAYNMESLNLINSDTHFCWDPTGVK
ncbi:Glyoxal reductase, partial [Acropora cervicornis]